MSSSKVIKFADNNPAILNYDFRAIGFEMTSGEERVANGFVPMAMFDTSEMPEWGNEHQADEVEESGPPKIEMTEDEFNQRINDAFNSGLQDGKNLAERGLINVFKALRTASESLHDLREKVLREAEDELIHLVMMVARKVVMQEVSQDRTILSTMVQAALENVSKREEVTVRISPQDYALVISGHAECLKKELLCDRLQLKADPAIEMGGCQIDTEMGTIDATIDAQLEEIYRHLLEQKSTTQAETVV